jgi:hypothetical protein
VLCAAFSALALHEKFTEWRPRNFMGETGFVRNFNALLVGLALALGGVNAASAQVVRVDLQPKGGTFPSVDATGVDSVATGLNPVFASNGADAWNHLNLPSYGVFTTNPSFTGLVDSKTGIATAISFSITGTFTAASGMLDNATNPLKDDYFASLGNPMGYQIAGLTANADYAFITYAPTFANRGYALTVNGAVLNVVSGSTPYAYTLVKASAAGTISGIWSRTTGEADWSGFQLAAVAGAVPEPSSWAMMIGGIGLLGGTLRMRRRKLALA